MDAVGRVKSVMLADVGMCMRDEKAFTMILDGPGAVFSGLSSTVLSYFMV